jgi:hypothetical protein
MSFAFMARDEAWYLDDGLPVREVFDMTMSEVSPVSFPAYPATTLSTGADGTGRTANAARAVGPAVRDECAAGDDRMEGTAETGAFSSTERASDRLYSRSATLQTWAQTEQRTERASAERAVTTGSLEPHLSQRWIVIRLYMRRSGPVYGASLDFMLSDGLGCFQRNAQAKQRM